jgi:septum formation protein
VQFKVLDQQEIRDYIATGCPMDKAGAYAIQGGAAHFVRAINGSYTNVVGLPMTELYETLQQLGVL